MTEKKPNILIIHTDEHNLKTLGCYRETLPHDQAYQWGAEAVETPNIDWIAETGALCTNFYATTPVCTPSRGSMMSGQYPHRNGAHRNNIPLKDDTETFAHVLSRRGYATGYVGKWHLAGYGKPQWQPEDGMGFDDNRYMFNRGHWKKLILTPEGPDIGTDKADWDEPRYAVDGADETSFTTDWLTDRALEFIEKHQKEPFCCLLSLPDPHGPNTVREPYDAMYPLPGFRLPPTFHAQENTSFEASFLRPSEKHAALDEEKMKTIMTQYYGMVKCIDDNVGRLLESLRDKKLIENTVIIFVSDHGDLCGEHHKLDKGDPFEMSARVPFVIRFPGKIREGFRVEEVMSMVDFKPTLMSLLGIPAKEARKPLEGQDGAFLFTGQEGTWNNISFLRAQEKWVCAVDERHKLIIPISAEDGGAILLDRRADPEELTDFLGAPEKGKIIGKLAEAMREYGERFDDPHYGSDHVRRILGDPCRA